MRVLSNSNPKILGTDGHSADLTGSVNADTDSTAVSNLQGSSTFLSANLHHSDFTTNQVTVTVSSVVVASGEKVLLTYVWVSSADDNNQTGASTHSIQRDGSEITTVGNGNYSGAGIFRNAEFLDDPGAGTYTYTVKMTVAGANYSYVGLRATVITTTDTHVASLIGTNSQSTHEGKVLP